MGHDGKGTAGLEGVNAHLIRRGVKRGKREEYPPDMDPVVIESKKPEGGNPPKVDSYGDERPC